MLKKYNRYFYVYLTLVFVLAWSIMISCAVFKDVLTPIIGELTMDNPVIVFVLYLPSLTGLLIYYIYGGSSAVKSLFLKLIPERKDLIWFPILSLIFALYAVTMHFGSIYFDAGVPKITLTLPQLIAKGLWFFIGEVGLIGGIFGWIGFLLPFLQGKFKNNILAASLTGFIFGLWVLPGYGLSSTEAATSYILYVLQLMAFIVFASYVFNATRGNLSFYLFSFWLAATGSHIQLYNFCITVQIMEITFLILTTVILHYAFKKLNITFKLQQFPDFIERFEGSMPRFFQLKDMVKQS